MRRQAARTWRAVQQQVPRPMSNPQAGSAQTEAIAAKHRSGLRHGCVRLDNAVLNTLQAIALDATRRLHPLALSSIVSTLALLGVSTLRATHSASSHWSAVGEIAAAMHAPSTASAHPSAPSRTFAERPGLRHKLITRVSSDDQDSPEFYYTRNTF